MAKKKEKKLELPLLDDLRERDQISLLNQHYEIPEYITDNLKHGNSFREYQLGALRHMHYLMSEEKYELFRKNGQLLFNMATGSGKTDLMAALMLYLLEEYDYHNFLFVVNTSGVVNKTKMNLLDRNSPKYLFGQTININGRIVTIEGVNRFPAHPNNNTIYLKTTTIQGLDSELVREVGGKYYGHEGGLTIDELAQNKLVILGDEAHHFSAFTKKNLSKKEVEQKSWEQMLDEIRRANAENIQLEFTATIDLEDSSIYEKYKDKIIYQYGLDEFIEAGYSKKVFRLESENDDRTKMLNAVLLSQYRKRVAKNLDIADFKPVVMFKSAKIDVSLEMNTFFNTMINDLSVEDLEQHISQQLKATTSPTLQLVFQQFSNDNAAELLTELKSDFAKERIINVNDNSSRSILDDANDVNALNTLEDPNNPFRAVFAVAKLTEGWDVLNLYDIVRISENATGTSAAVGSEAQLVGRGARYNPFEYKGERSFKRRFDNLGTTSEQDMQLLESLHYHTSSDSAYLKNLRKALDNINLIMYDEKKTKIYSAKLTNSFKKSETYNHGILYSNVTEDVPVSDYTSLSSYGINLGHTEWKANLINVTRETTFADEGDEIGTHTIPLHPDMRLINKAMQKSPFFSSFATMQTKLPNVKSRREFIEGDSWLNLKELVINVEVSVNKNALTRDEQLKATSQLLDYVYGQVTRGFMKLRGTNKFEGVLLRDAIPSEYNRMETIADNSNYLRSKIDEATYVQWKGADWFAYDKAVADGLEAQFITSKFNSMAPSLRDKYDEVYLLRNDERQRNSVTLHQFSNNTDVHHFEGFKPDFILYLLNGDEVIQVFIEPKGPQLVEQDRWKEELLMSLDNEDIILLGENKHVKLLGVHFYTGRVDYDTDGKVTDVQKDLEELLGDGQEIFKTTF